MASVPQLVDDLCEALLQAAKAHSGQRRGSRKKAKQSLKRVAYNVLFTSLFQDETRKLQPGLPRYPVKNRILMLSFDLRVSGLGAEADRLEELVEELEAAHRRPLAELGSVLDLLVRLAGSGPPRMLRRRRDFFLHSRPVGRDVPYGGYDCADLSALEADVRSLIYGEEYLCRDLVRKTLQVMEAAPGTGLPAVGLFSYGDPCGDRFERDTRVSLFGALVHSRTADLDVRLDLPPVSDSAELSGLAIKVPSSVDPSEDEGFQSASNLTPDSQSEPGVTPDIDLWDAVLTFEASKRRCWEQVGCPPGHREEPYLTEAGRAAFDRTCGLCQAGLQVLGGGLLQAPQPVLVKECELVKDALNILIGVVSATFSLCQPAQAFTVKQGVHVSGASPESVSSLLSEVAECGTHYARLSRFSLQPVLDSSCSEGLVFQAFSSGLRRYLQYYRACVLSTPPTLSLLAIAFLFKKLGRQLRYLAELCGVGTGLLGAGGGAPGAAFPTGVKLLSYLYQEALDNCSNEHYPVLLSLLKTSCEPYTRFIHDWVYSGVFRDVYGEFMIQVNPEYLGFRDKSYWTHGYALISKEVEDCVPVFLRHVAHDVYVCGKTINLLKLCCPRHYLCCSDVPVPRISVIFSLEELKDIEKDCATYVGRMERVARHSSISKEEKELRVEIAKQELIVQAREAASRVLSALSDRQLSERMALDARKREQFQRLKEQFVKDRERRRAARREELDDDFGYARELRDRQRRLKALEEQLERKARQALVDHYSKLSAEAARREQKALWKVQRHRLAGARLRFLLEDQKRIQELLEDMAEGKPLEPLAILPGARSQASFVGSERPAGGGSCDSGPGETREAARGGPERPGVLPRQPRASPAAAACRSGPGAGPPSEQAEGPGPSSVGLSLRDFLPAAPGAEQPVPTSAAPVLDEALQTIGSDLPPLAPSAAADTGPSGPQEYDFRTILRPSVAAPASPGALRTAEGSLGGEGQQLREDTHVQLDACVPDGRVALPCAQPPQRPSRQEDSSPATGQLRGQVAEPGVPTEGYPSGMAPSRPRWNVHGHVSDASIRVGENVWDVAPSRPRWNVHGHVSQSSVMLGVLSGDAEPNVPGPPWAPPDHGSQSGLSLGAQSPAREPEPRLPAETASGGSGAQVARPGSGRGEESGLQALLSAEAAPTALEDSIPEEPGPGASGDSQDLSPSGPPSSQEGADTRSSPGPGEEAAQRWDREQAYLAGLAGQYCLERYPDSYEAMSEPPVARLLHHGLPRAFALPEEPGAQSDADASAVQPSELLPLPVLMKHSVTAPLAAHVSLVNKAAVDYFFVELHLGAHFEALRHFLLMEDGEFAQSLSDLLFEKLGAGQTPGELLSPLALNSVLSKALQYSLHGDTPHAANLSFALKFLPETFAPNAPDVLSCLELRYKVDWPLNIVVTEGCLSRYSGIFSFLLQLKLMMWTLKDVCFHLKRTARVSHAAGSVQFRQLQLFKHEMQHFVKVIQGYIANQILHVTWCEFQARLASVGDLEEVQRAHAEYLHKAVFRGLLTEKAAPVMNIIHSIFSLVLKFRSQLISQPWGPASGPRGPEHPSFALLQQSYSTFNGEQAGEPRLPAPPGGLPAAHQLQQLLPGRLRPVWPWRVPGPQ
ncbi:gamma-tubulin complex component 6 isoform X1 [Physeter macrocephalus]|uniref:Gamma-tubulin complex component 6 n=1 Tax=Physeter macrocephalus TaxID=9755 RepID=A0A455BCY0_PHYMC|nr:gamma-tubulin complex component 6 isoform X1 [Physeter catodon]XP_054941330.1 gamma-tubulin complex component 6 isoform X1 [Physeter catodon]|eukprot:XP_028346579.1 gamma-tubulin complex component 6 isoform X1 [Physeter catodon]